MVPQQNILMKLSIKADSKIYIKFLFNKQTKYYIN